jgi:pimeloyl-ACP methyl ester carboxylesterase
MRSVVRNVLQISVSVSLLFILQTVVVSQHPARRRSRLDVVTNEAFQDIRDRQDENLVADFTKITLELADSGRMNCYLRQGIGPTLVLVPGTWGGLWRFESLIAALPRTIGIAVVELPWQAGNKPPSLDMSMEQIADDVLTAIEAMKLEHFVVAGHSIGGMIAVEIAGRDVPGLVGAIPMEGWTHHTVVKTAFGGTVVSNLTPEEESRRQADRMRGRRHLSEKELQAVGTIWRRWDGYDCLQRSTIPVLEIWGDRGEPRPNREALRVPDRNNIEISWITDASHLVLLEDPDQVARLVLEFMKKNN